MKLHANAALSLKQRERMVATVINDGASIKAAAEQFNTSERTCSKWVARYRSEGRAGLLDRCSAPSSSQTKTSEERVQLIAALRRLRFTSPELAELLGMPISTVSAVLKRIGMNRLGRLGMEPARRYERARPGELIHIDVKKLGRIQGGAGKRITGRQGTNRRLTATAGDGKRRGTKGWDAVHVAIDDATRLAYAEVLPDEKATTRPYRPQTNGKAERFIRTMLGGWAYGAIYRSSDERTAALDGWLWHYNHRRQHQALSRQTPACRLNNLLGTYN